MINVKNLAVLYPWEEALKASPAGWRLPTSGDWEQLEIELGMDPDAAETFGWRGTDQGAQLKEGGSSGFDALLSGYKDGTVLWDGRYFDIGYFGAFWMLRNMIQSKLWPDLFMLPMTIFTRDRMIRQQPYQSDVLKDD